MTLSRTLRFFLVTLFLAACSASTDAETDSSSIENGKEISIESAPWQVSIEVKDWNSPEYHKCGGAILAPTWVVTAHHCLAGYTDTSSLLIVAGNANLANVDDPAEQLSYVDRSFPYSFPSIPSPVIDSASDAVDREHDIELLHLENPLDLSGTKVRAIPIVDAEGVAAKLTDPGVKAYVTGYGEQGFGGGAKLKGGPTTIVANATLEAALHKIPAAENPEGWNYQTLVLSPGEIAAGVAGARHCHGDSGGPLTVPTPGGGSALAGIVSWSATCDDPKMPGVYARVSEFAPWIKETMATHDAALARAASAAAAAGDATSRKLDASTACKLVEAYVFGEGHEHVRGYQIDPPSFKCTGSVTTRPEAKGQISYAAVGGIGFKTRGSSPHSFALNACFTHPVDDDKAWWISKLSTSACF